MLKENNAKYFRAQFFLKRYQTERRIEYLKKKQEGKKYFKRLKFYITTIINSKLVLNWKLFWDRCL